MRDTIQGTHVWSCDGEGVPTRTPVALSSRGVQGEHVLPVWGVTSGCEGLWGHLITRQVRYVPGAQDMLSPSGPNISLAHQHQLDPLRSSTHCREQTSMPLYSYIHICLLHQMPHSNLPCFYNPLEKKGSRKFSTVLSFKKYKNEHYDDRRVLRGRTDKYIQKYIRLLVCGSWALGQGCAVKPRPPKPSSSASAGPG